MLPVDSKQKMKTEKREKSNCYKTGLAFRDEQHAILPYLLPRVLFQMIIFPQNQNVFNSVKKNTKNTVVSYQNESFSSK